MSKTRRGQGVARARRSQRRHRVLTAPCTGAHPLRALLRSTVARPLRFALTGGLAGLLQLGLLALLVRRGWPAAPANALAFLLPAQVNFAVSSLFTWRDRRRTGPLWRRWLAIHGAIAAMALVNKGVFLAARTVLPALAASAVGIAVAAVGNYLLGDRLVFGARALSTRKIAREAAVNLATLHDLSGSKDDLLLAVLDAATSTMIAALVVDAQPGRGLRAVLADSFAVLCALLDHMPALPLVRCELLYASRRPAQAARVLQQQQRYLDALAVCYRVACAEGELGLMPSEDLAAVVSSSIDGLALQTAAGVPGVPGPQQAATRAPAARPAPPGAAPPTRARSSQHG